MTAENFVRMARERSMQPRYLTRQARAMADRLGPAMDQAVREISPVLTSSARALVERLQRFVDSPMPGVQATTSSTGTPRASVV